MLSPYLVGNFSTNYKVMGRLSKLADFLQKSVTLTCMVGTVYLLVMTGRNYLTLREKRLANAALIEAKAEDEHASAKQEEEQTISQVHGFLTKVKVVSKTSTYALTLSCTNCSSRTVHKVIVLIIIWQTQS